MTVVSTLDIADLTATEYRKVMDELGVEKRPEGGIFLHLTTPTDDGFRVVEIWDDKEGFDRFVERRLGPASEAVGVEHSMSITVWPLHNFFAPRLNELPGLVGRRSQSRPWRLGPVRWRFPPAALGGCGSC
jgi:hypothetical protein